LKEIPGQNCYCLLFAEGSNNINKSAKERDLLYGRPLSQMRTKLDKRKGEGEGSVGKHVFLADVFYGRGLKTNGWCHTI